MVFYSRVIQERLFFQPNKNTYSSSFVEDVLQQWSTSLNGLSLAICHHDTSSMHSINENLRLPKNAHHQR